MPKARQKIKNYGNNFPDRCKRCRGFGNYLYGYNDEERTCEDCKGTGRKCVDA